MGEGRDEPYKIGSSLEDEVQNVQLFDVIRVPPERLESEVVVGNVRGEMAAMATLIDIGGMVMLWDNIAEVLAVQIGKELEQ